MCEPSITTWGYSSTLSTPTFTMIRISSEEIPNSFMENRISPRRREMKVRKNEIELRKKEIISPKSSFVPPWKMRNLYGGISDFLRRRR